MFSCCVSVDKPRGFNCSPWQAAHHKLSSWQPRAHGEGGRCHQAGGTWSSAGHSRQEK